MTRERKAKRKACRICKEPGADGHTCSLESYLRNHPEFAAELARRGTVEP